jgi:rhodanese-related sulfurtransferase
MAVGLKELIARARAAVREIPPAAVKDGVDRGEIDLVVDVREPREWQEGHVPGAVNVPRGLLELKADPESPVADPALSRHEASVVVYCTKGPGARSLLAAETLTEMGFANVAVLAGGLNGWREAGLPVDEAT